jgi:hypothetical protein
MRDALGRGHSEETLFENLETARYVLQAFLSINGQMNECLESAGRGVSPAELKSFKRGVGYIMCEVFDKIIEPICKRHPSLKPPEMED